MGQVRRSLQASPAGIEKARRALICHSISQNALAKELQITRQTVGKFLRGERVDRQYFVQISENLELDWEDLVARPANDSIAHEIQPSVRFDAVVQELHQRGQASIQHRCGTVRVLGMSRPITLSNIYTDVSVLEKVTGRRWLDVADLAEASCDTGLERPDLGRIDPERIPVLQAIQKHPKLIVLGKPGSGKTTLLKYLAIQCSAGQFQSNKIPIFVKARDFAEAEDLSFQAHVTRQLLEDYGVRDSHLIEQLLSQGRVVILLDGLDEVREEDSSRVIELVRRFSDQYHHNHFTFTCRTAASEYLFEKFTEVEIADFDVHQIRSFAYNWFSRTQPLKAEKFIQKLQQNPPLQELAINPLLATLLCLVFEESETFPSSHSELYQEGLYVLLQKWDAERNVERPTYQALSTQDKEDLLSQIALGTFKRGNFFFKKKQVEQYIAAYLETLPTADADSKAGQASSKAVLKSIEVQHGLLVERAKGVYSFSHLAFQEYFAARAIAIDVGSEGPKQTLNDLVSQITNKRWHEVYLMSVEMLPNPEDLLRLMKQQTEAILPEDKPLQNFLVWLRQKSGSVTAPYQPAVIRAFYLDLALTRVFGLIGGTFDLARLLERNLTCNLAPCLALDLALDRVLGLNCVFGRVSNFPRVVSCTLERALGYARCLDPLLEQSLQQLAEQLPDLEQIERFKLWWQVNSQAWLKELSDAMITYRDLGGNWQLNKQQQVALKQYYEANQLLVKCLRASRCDFALQAEIEETLLLAIATRN